MRTQEKVIKQIQNENEITEKINEEIFKWKIGEISTNKLINELDKIKNSLEKIQKIEDTLIFNNLKTF